MARRETLEGYLVDIESFRSQPGGDPVTRARAHPRDRLLAGTGRETAYGLVTDDGRLIELDGGARDHVAEAVRDNPHQSGIRVQVEREDRGGRMTTTAIHTTEGLPSSMAGGKDGRGWDPWKGQEDT